VNAVTKSAGLDLLVIQPTSLCNLDCSYCYVPDRQNAHRLPIPLLEKLCQAVQCARLTQEQEGIDILWHAGEPLAAGITYFRQALAVTQQLLGNRFQIRHSIQTNGTLITSEWCDLFRAEGVTVGISLDGPAAIHDANRKRLDGSGSFAGVIRGLELLRAHNIPINILSVLNAQNIDHPDEMFHFYVDHDLRNIAFNVEEIEGPHLQSSILPDRKNNFASSRLRYRTFMGRFAEMNRDRGWPLTVREFLSLAQIIQQWRKSAQPPVVPEQRVGAILTMARDGSLYSWSPELASGTKGALNRFSLGNISDVQSVDEFLVSEGARAIQHEIDHGVEMCREHCEYFSVCGGGSPGNKFYERGTFATTETLKCALQTQELVEVILSAFSGH
jgi:uncharacterized protein